LLQVGYGLVIGKILILPVFAVIILATVGYQEAYGITFQSTLGPSNPDPNQNFNVLDRITVDLAGKIYVTDENNHRIQIFDATKTYLATIGVTGVSGIDNSHLKFPDGVAVDSSGKVYVADTDNQRIQIFPAGGTIATSTIGVTGVFGSANNKFSFPSGIAVDSSGKVYVADTGNHRVQIFPAGGTIATSTIGVTGVFGSANNKFNSPSGIAVDSSGNIYVADTGNHRIQIFNSTRNYQATIGTGVAGSGNNQFNFPNGVAVDSSGNIYVADTGNKRVQIFDATRTYQATIGTGVAGSGNDQFSSPSSVAVDSSGNIYVSDSFNFRVQTFSGLGTSGTANTLGHSGDNPPPSRIKPSFGGVGNMVFPDGLTLGGKVYDLNNFKVNIPQTIADIGQPIKIKIKEQLGHGPTDWKYVAVYMNFGGKDPETYNANLILSIDKNEGQKLVDPKGYIKDFNATTTLDDTYVYTTFSFTATKAMPDSSMIVAAWDGHNRVNNVYVGGAIQFGQNATVISYHLPAWVHQYTNLHDADYAIENAGYQKPLIFSHMSNSDQIWKGSDGGSIKWLVDDHKQTVSIVIYGNNGNVVSEKTESLKKNSMYSKCTGSNCMYSWNNYGQLSRTDSDQVDKVKKSEEDRVFTSLHNMGYTGYFDHNHTH